MRGERWFGLILIIAGVYLLGAVRHWWAWFDFGYWLGLAFDYWPIWLILAGGLILLSPRLSFRLVLGLILGLIILLFLLSLPVGYVVRREESISSRLHQFETTLAYPQPPAAGETVQVELDVAAGAVDWEIGTLADTATPGKNLLRAYLEYWRAEPRVELDTLRRGGNRAYKIEVKQGREGIDFGMFRGRGARWQLDLSPTAVWAIEADTGASRCDWDLSDLRLASLDVGAGAGDVEITLPGTAAWSAMNTSLPGEPIPVSLEAGAASVTIRVPEDAGIEVHLDTALTSHNLTDEGFVKESNGRFVTENFNTARLRYSLEADLGVAHFELERVPGDGVVPESASA
jgi:hypothetical protein